VNTVKTRRVFPLEIKRQILKEFAQSGLSLSEFARRRKLARTMLDRWQRDAKNNKRRSR